MSNVLLQKFTKNHALPLGKLTTISHRKDPLDKQAGALRPDEEKVEILLDSQHGNIFKIAPASFSTKLKNNYRASSIAHQNGIECAEPIAEPEEIEGKTISVESYISHNHRSTPDPIKVGKLVARLHTIQLSCTQLPQVTSQLPKIANDVLSKDSVSDDIKKQIREKCLPCIELVQKDMARHTNFIHGDLHLGNILPAANGPALIDFECAGAGSPLWDIATIVQSMERFGLDNNWGRACLAAWRLGLRCDLGLLDEYVNWRCWYGVLSMIKRCQKGTGFEKELASRLKWLFDQNDKSRWTRC